MSDYSQAMKQARSAALNAQTPDAVEGLKARASVHAFQTNPDCKIVVYARVLREGRDAAANYLAASDLPTSSPLYKAVDKLAHGVVLSADEQAIVEDESRKSARLRTALAMYGTGVTETTTTPIDMSQCVLEWSLRKSMRVQGGSATIRAQVDLEDALRQVGLGDRFYIALDGEFVFWGICMSVVQPNEHEIEYTVNDSMWYLKNQLVWVQNKPIRLDEVFSTICENLALPYEKPDPVPIAIKPRVETNATAMSLMQDAITEAAITGGALYAVRMNPVKLELIDVQKANRSGTRLDVVEAMTSFTARQSIEDETYNEVRLFADNGGALKAYTVQDLPFMERFGILRYQEVFNNAIVRESQLDEVISITKYPTGDLSFDIVGIVNLMPADAICLMQSIYVVSDIVYNYTANGYTMSITCARWQEPSKETMFQKWDFSQEYARVVNLKW